MIFNNFSAVIFPIKNPVLIFAIILIIILLIPIFLKKISIPGIIGFIIAGVAMGPKGINLLERDASIELFGTVGLLYIMFTAGLEIDINGFKRNKHKSLIFGIITFLLPIIFGYAGATFLLKMEMLPAVLLAGMIASHTLIAYPIASRYGITRNESVTLSVGGTIITDILALLILAVIVGFKHNNITAFFWIKIIADFILLLFIAYWALPKLTVWFFRNVSEDGEQQFIYVLLCVFLLALLTGVAGLEPIIGAFFAGLSLNRYVPSSSALMNRIHFVGNTIFIPFFLISVGMLVDVRVLFKGVGSLFVAGTLIVIAVTAKYIAAYIIQKIFKYSSEERNVVFGLSSAQAAATLAIVTIAFNIGMFDISILNGTVILVFITCILSSFIVEREGKKLAVYEEQKEIGNNELPEKILIPVSDQNTIPHLIDFSMMIKDTSSEEPVFALTVVRDSLEPEAVILKSSKRLDKAVDYASAGESMLQVITRVDLNIANGILRGIKELVISDIVLEWKGKFSSRQKVIGNVLDQLLNGSYKTFYICRIIHPINTINRIIILVPNYADYEKGFSKWINKVKKLTTEIKAELQFFGSRNTLISIKNILENNKPVIRAEYHEIDKVEKLNLKQVDINNQDLFLFVSARRDTISWHRYLDVFPKRFIKSFADVNLIVLYPEQYI